MLGKHSSKTNQQFSIQLIRNLSFCSIVYLSSWGILSANPQNPTVVAGSATFDHINPSTLQVQAQDRTIINWESFSIDPNELTAFIQPGSSATVLNRVIGNDLSVLLGMLKSNGSVYLINTNGILIGNGAIIDTGSFVASSLDTLDSAYLAGQDLPFLGNSQASVVNYGTVRSSAGDIILLGYHVDNQGELIADQGAVRLGAGNNLLLQVNGQERIVIKAESGSYEQNGTGVDNNGSIHAVIAELKADGNPYQYGINHRGTIDATGIVAKNGQVFLQADNGRIQVSGKTYASNHDNTGGNIRILGDQINIDNTAVVYASGDYSGGEILIGGDFQGKNPDITNASQVYIQRDAQMFADANIHGDGGRIIHWSEDGMYHYGSDSAKGGQQSGNGGLVETSGKNYMDYQGFADLRSEKGHAGTLLLDPTNLTISAAADANVPAVTPFYPTPTPGTTANLSAATLTAALGASNVTVQTGNDGGVGAGDITWDPTAVVNVATANDLTLQSAGHLIMSGYYANAGPGNVYFNAASDITVNTNGTAIDTNTGSINLNGQNIFVQGAAGVPTVIGSGTAGPANFTATGGQIFIEGGNALNATTDILSANDIRLTATGNINLNAGTQQNTSASMQSFGGSVSLTSINDSVVMQGGADITGPVSSTVTAANAINVNTGLDCLLTAGTGTSSSAAMTAGNEVRANIGGSCRLIAGSGSNSSAASIQGTNGVSGTIGQDLVLQAGSNSNNTATIATTSQTGSTIDLAIGRDLIMTGGTGFQTYAALMAQTGNILLSMDRDLMMTPGTQFSSFTQIGSVPLLSTDLAQASITVSNVGRNIVMGTNPVLSQTYAVIGNGNLFVTLDDPVYSGDIIVNGSSSASLLLAGSRSIQGNAFSQIGHIGSFTTNGASYFSNINVNGFGGPVTLKPNLNYAVIGHGNLSGAASQINGNVSVEAISGPISLEPGDASLTFAQIGSFNGISIISDVTVATTGNLELTAGNIVDSRSIIGQSGLGSVSSITNPQFSGKILVSADAIRLNGGIHGPVNNAVIGFEPGHGASFTIPSSCSIDPRSTITVTAVHDINLQAGNDVFNSDGGNAIIGHLANAPSLPAPLGSTISNITVKSTEGNITLCGGSVSPESIITRGQALIGTSANPNVNNNLPQSNITINAAENLSLYGITPTSFATGGGSALITNSAANQPFDINITAGNILLSGGNPVGTPGNLGSGSAAIVSGRNLNITSLTDLQMISNLGMTNIFGFGAFNTFTIGQDLVLQAGARSALIGSPSFFGGSGSNSTTFSIGRDLSLTAGSASNAFAQIGNLAPLAQSDLNFTNIGGSIYLRGSSTNGVNNSYAAIGHGNLLGINATAMAGNISMAGNATTNLYLDGGTGNQLSNNFAQIGHFGVNNIASVSGDLLFSGLGGATNLNANSNYAAIGHGNIGFLTTNNVQGDITFLGTGSSNLNLRGGNSLPAFASIGHFGWQSLLSAQGNINISGIGGNLSIDADLGSYAAVGHSNLLFTGGSSGITGNISITGTPGATLILSGGSNNGFGQIGHFGRSNTPQINGDISVSSFGVGIDLTPNTSYSLIGHGSAGNTATAISGGILMNNHTCQINLNAGQEIRTFAQVGHINAQNTTGNVTVETTNALSLTAGNFLETKALIGQGGLFSPSDANFSGKIQVAADNIQLNGGINGLDANAVIGFESGHFGCNVNESSTITVTAIHDIALQAGNDFSNTDGGNAIIGHAANAFSFPVSTINNITVTSTEGSITLNGGSVSANPVANFRGMSLIGTQDRSGSNNPAQSNVIVNVKNTLRLFGIAPNSFATGGGMALIANGSSGQPFDINIDAGNILLSGGNPIGGQGAGLAAIASSRNLNIKSATDLQLISLLGRTSVSGNGPSNTYAIGQDLIMQAGANSSQIGTFSAAGVTSSTFSIGRDLQMTAGLASNAFVQIGDLAPSAQSDLNFTNIGGSVLVQASTAASVSNAYAAIGHGNFSGIQTSEISGNITMAGSPSTNLTLNGGTTFGSNNALIGHFGTNGVSSVSGNITLNEMGGDLILNGLGNAAGIGHSSLFFSSTTVAGDIAISGLTSTNLTLNGANVQGSFSGAQIGHHGWQNLTLASGNINITGIGGNTSLNPFLSRSSIGHGSDTTLFSNISGNISLDMLQGPISLNPGTSTASLSIIGHNNATSILGDVTVHTADNLSVKAANTANARALIGHTGPSAATASGKINVSANQIDIAAGASSDANATIGFATIGTVLPSSEITVNTVNDLTLQAGALPGGDGGNAVIGYLASAASNVTFNNLLVSSKLGSVILTGGTSGSGSLQGVSLIGAMSSIGGNSPKSNVQINARDGSVVLYGTPTGNPSFAGGRAVISTGQSTDPYDLMINAANLNLFGSNGVTSTGAGSAQVTAARNLTLDLSENLEVTANLGNASIAQNNGAMTISLGGDCSVRGGTQATSIAQIGNATANGNANPIQFTNIGGNLLVRAATGAALIGHGGGNNAGTINSNLTFRNIDGNVTVAGGTSAGSYAQIGHAGQGTSNPVTINGDVRLEQVSGAVILTGGSSTNTSAVIGLGNTATIAGNSSLNGQVVVNSDSVTLTGGGAAFSDAVIGFSLPAAASGSAINSSLVNIDSKGSVVLTAGNDSNSVIGFASGSLAAPDVTIANVVVNANGGGAALTGGVQGGSSGGIACIGTFGNAGGSLQSSVKVKSPFDVILANSGSGRAMITNSNTTAAGNTRTVSIDPARIVLLGGGGSSTIFSTGNLSLNVSDALDLNYSGNPATLQNGSAAILAVGDILINTTGPSLAEIRLQGGSNAAFSAQITSSSGNVQIGSPENVGAGNVFVGSSAMAGPASINAANDLKMFINGDVTETSGAAAAASLLAGSDLIIYAGGDAVLQGSGGANASIASTTGDITLNAGGSARLTQGGRITNGAGNTDITTGFDLSLTQNGLIQNAGSGSIKAEAGRDLILSNTAAMTNNGNGQMSIATGRDAVIGGSAALVNNGSGDISLTTLRDINTSGSGSMVSTGGGNNLAAAGRDILVSGSFSFNTTAAGKMDLSAGRNIAISGTASLNDLSSGSLTLDGKSDIILSGNALVRTATGNGLLIAGRNATLSNAAAIASNSAINALYLYAGNDIGLTGTSSARVTGGADLFMVANHNMNLNQSAAVTTAGGNLTLVVDNSSPYPKFYGTGRIATDAGATVNAGGGAIRIFTSRQPFNIISSLLNGAAFVPGIQYTNTAQEQWCSYYETAFNGLPFTVFYKDGCPLLTCPVCPTCPTCPNCPNCPTCPICPICPSIPINPVCPCPVCPKNRHGSKDLKQIVISLSEALQEWRTMDNPDYIPETFCLARYCSDSDCGNLYACATDCECYTTFRRGRPTYNTKWWLFPYYP